MEGSTKRRFFAVLHQPQSRKRAKPVDDDDADTHAAASAVIICRTRGRRTVNSV
jgi:hypothetical protein